MKSPFSPFSPFSSLPSLSSLSSPITWLGLLMLACLLIPSGGCGAGHGGDTATERAMETDPDPATIWTDSVMACMTLEEKAGQLFMPAVYSRLDGTDIEMLRFYADSCHVGGILLLQGSAGEASATAREIHRLSKIAPWVAIDAEWGLGMRIEDAPAFPRNGRIDPANGFPELFDYGEELARECRVLGINMVMGPVVDVAAEGSFIGNRSFGTDPQRVADMATAYASGLESGGVVSVAKHFPGHGRGRADSHRETPVVNVSKDSLESTDLYPFRRYADAGLSAIMAGHISVPALDPAGLPATVSKAMLTGFLRDEIGFEGLIITDALNMEGAAGYRGADAIAAGADLVVAPAHTLPEIREVVKRVRSGEMSEDEVDERCRRVLLFKYRHKVAGPLRRKVIGGSEERLRRVLSFGTDSLRERLEKGRR